MNIKKVNEYVWEVPKQGNMKVPARIFASEKLIEKIKGDKTLQQAINVAHLNGIQTAALVMPDAHQGYGFPIGGVAAFDMDEGIICPGGIGFDINCLYPETTISLKHGVYMKIKDIVTAPAENAIRHADFKQFNLHHSSMLLSMSRKENEKLYEITTNTGKKIKVTGDHPIYTKKGMVEAKYVSTTDYVAVCGFKGIHFKEANNEIILTEEDIRRVLDEKTVSQGNALPQIMKFLEEDEFVLKQSSVFLPYLAKILGFVFGDGSISFVNKKKGIVWFYGEEEDLEELRKDVRMLGVTPSRIYKRTRKHSIKTFYKENTFVRTEKSFRVSSTAFAALLVALGAPAGNKTRQAYGVPEWLFACPLWIKRLFLAGLFGAEMSTPATSNKYNFYCPTLGMNKVETLEENAIQFLTQLRSLLAEFDIQTSEISRVKQYGVKTKNGRTCGYRLFVKSKNENLITFFETVSFAYNKKRFREACLAVNYLRLKQGIQEKRRKVRVLAVQAYKNKMSVREIVSELESKHTSSSFIKHAIWSKGREHSRIGSNALSFAEYKDKYALGDNGLAWDEIVSVEEIPYQGDVYDITMNHEDHNFIANSFIVSNCGVRLLRTDFAEEDINPKKNELLKGLLKEVPAGVGRAGKLIMAKQELLEVLSKGGQWCVEQGYASKEDLQRTEEYGWMKTADTSFVSTRALARGKAQVGTLGSGNHFMEIQKVDKIFDEKIAKAFGIEKEGQIMVMIHCGSRGFGHQVASDYIKAMEKKYGHHNLPDRQLINAPIHSELGQNYVKAMHTAMNFAFANRQMITHWTRGVFQKIIGSSLGMDMVYDVCHNIAKFEKHVVDGEKKEVCVHRKGATRAFGPGREEIPDVYRDIGQPILIPGSMGTASYVLVGTKKAEEVSFGSTAHGAGRLESRSSALRKYKADDIKSSLKSRGIDVVSTTWKAIVEEAPQVYKDVDEVVKVSHQAGIGKMVARLVPLGVVKG
jgi:tRNA-splicing ligase RtcB (3'-phosphate/5'-hydroxy nucleic acid ligase)